MGGGEGRGEKKWCDNGRGGGILDRHPDGSYSS